MGNRKNGSSKRISTGRNCANIMRTSFSIVKEIGSWKTRRPLWTFWAICLRSYKDRARTLGSTFSNGKCCSMFRSSTPCSFGTSILLRRSSPSISEDKKTTRNASWENSPNLWINATARSKSWNHIPTSGSTQRWNLPFWTTSSKNWYLELKLYISGNFPTISTAMANTSISSILWSTNWSIWENGTSTQKTATKSCSWRATISTTNYCWFAVGSSEPWITTFLARPRPTNLSRICKKKRIWGIMRSSAKISSKFWNFREISSRNWFWS